MLFLLDLFCDFSEGWAPFSQKRFEPEIVYYWYFYSSVVAIFYGGNYLFSVSDRCIGCCTCWGSNLKPILLTHVCSMISSHPMWLGIQQKTISLFDVECSLQSSLIISGCSSFLLFNDNRTESESENMMNFLCFSFEIMSRAKSIAQASAVKIELSIGRAFVFYYYV